jgi:TonB family protein
MNRLEKKCLIVSTGTHLLLAAILVVSPAFVSSKNRSVDLPLLEFVPLKTVDTMSKGGGNPNAQPPPSAPVAKPQPVAAAPAPLPKPEPETPRPAKPEVAKVEKPEIVKPEPDSLEPSKERKRRMPEISTKLVPRKSNNRPELKTKASTNDTEREQAEARRQLARRIGQVADNLGSELSSSTKLELKGPGGGGVPYANFLQSVQSVYQRVWRGMVPDGATDSEATAAASVTIARDGTVLSYSLTEPSGNKRVDHAVLLTLQKVPTAAPLPDDAKEDQRTVTIYFNVKPNRGIG